MTTGVRKTRHLGLAAFCCNVMRSEVQPHKRHAFSSTEKRDPILF